MGQNEEFLLVKEHMSKYFNQIDRFYSFLNEKTGDAIDFIKPRVKSQKCKICFISWNEIGHRDADRLLNHLWRTYLRENCEHPGEQIKDDYMGGEICGACGEQW